MTTIIDTIRRKYISMMMMVLLKICTNKTNCVMIYYIYIMLRVYLYAEQFFFKDVGLLF